jgi:peptidoglycan/LPS O-acetylase OafA/YrhL
VVSFVIAIAAIVWAPYITVANFLPAFALGAFVFKDDIRPNGKVAAWSVAGFIALTGLILITPFSYFIFNRPMDEYMEIDTFSFFWMLPILPFVAWSLRMRSDPLDRHLGNISYPLYLIHFTLFSLIGTGDPVAKIKAALIAILLATIIYIVIEQPLEHWRHWIVERMRRRAPAMA